ncbi:ABC transporter permease [Streptomyces sp. VRA16 Mangrove soil]|uniref:ABC transporter permease n=1 Tax=Streptomyces sp. VRA16 Mangrove soil TaxID=2817434 RepID=UPI001A9E0895|nr:ABC transporter permease [Streptomyces sp. VRA16 Mangrove soil]MBO1337527.1 ABC transporter permease [Streptomyces sp. VRA16 Mangrove soil]
MTVPAAVAHPGPRTALRPSGPVWTVLRLHRIALGIWIAYVSVTAGLLLWAWGPGRSGLGIDPHCAASTMNFCAGKGAYVGAVAWAEFLIGLVPLLAGVFAGGTLVGRELELGTARLAWTQGVRPARWLAATLAVPAVFLIAGTTLLVLLRRLAATGDAARLMENQWWQSSTTFGALGPAAAAWPLLGLAIGALAAFLMRRTVSGMGLAFFSTLLATVLVGAARNAFVWPPSVTYTLNKGVRLHSEVSSTTCRSTGDTCVAGQLTGIHGFWQLHLMETATVLALTALLVLLTHHILRRRVAA